MDYRKSKAWMARVCSVLATVLSLVGCYSPTASGPDEMYLEDLLGNLAEGRGCVALRYSVGETGNVLCYELSNGDLSPSAVFVDSVTNCRISGADVPTWNFGYDFQFERLGKTHLGTWIYEGYGDYTYIVKDRKLVNFCKGRIEPTDSFPPCSCPPQEKNPRTRERQEGGETPTGEPPEAE